MDPTEVHKVREDKESGPDCVTTCKDGKDYVVYGAEPWCPACGAELIWPEVIA